MVPSIREELSALRAKEVRLSGCRQRLIELALRRKPRKAHPEAH